MLSSNSYKTTTNAVTAVEAVFLSGFHRDYPFLRPLLEPAAEQEVSLYPCTIVLEKAERIRLAAGAASPH